MLAPRLRAVEEVRAVAVSAAVSPGSRSVEDLPPTLRLVETFVPRFPGSLVWPNVSVYELGKVRSADRHLYKKKNVLSCCKFVKSWSPKRRTFFWAEVLAMQGCQRLGLK